MDIYRSAKKSVFPALSCNISCDVLVIGGGATGLMCAYKLHKRGLTVAVVEKDIIASGKTAFNGGMLFLNGAPAYGDVLARCKNDVKSALREYGESFERIQGISEDVCDVTYKRVKALYYTEEWSKSAFEKMRDEYRRRYFSGEKCNFISRKDAMRLFSFGLSSGIITDSAAQHNPVAFCEKVADYLSLHGSEVFENSEIVSVSYSGTEAVFTSSVLNGSAVTSRAVVDCRGSAEICPEADTYCPSAYYLVTEPVKEFVGWYCGSIITDNCKFPLYLRTDENNRIIMILRSRDILCRLGGVYDRYMNRYCEELLRSMFFGIDDMEVEARGKYRLRLPKRCLCGAREDSSLKGVYYICSNNTLGLQDVEIMAEKTADAVLGALS